MVDISRQIDFSNNALMNLSNTITVTANTLLPSGANANVVFNTLTGATVTLPSPAKCPIGTRFDFFVGVVNTSNTYKVITDAATTFLAGGVYMDKALTVTRYAANGSTIRSINLAGSAQTTGGGTVGDYFKCVLISPTQWHIEGTLSATGTLATPFATS
ncbi:MAG TPA: hypothetical protein VGJ00_04110 [Rhabdochlamydiaceae bacterium]|jgi:hypothetical protein